MTYLSSRLLRAIRWTVWLSAVLPAAHAQVTESPETVKPGSFLVEMDGISLSMDRADAAGNVYDAVAVGTAILSTGVTDNLDVQAGFQLFHRETIDRGGSKDRNSGLGDLTLRAKWTFWRDVEWGASAAVIPYVKIPTNSGGVGNDSVEGGFIVPWAMQWEGGFTAGAMFQWDVIRNPADDGYDSRWFISGVVEQDIALGLKLYGELAFQVGSGSSSDAAGQLGVGARWKWSEQIELDYELLKGLNSRASEWTHVFRVNWGW